MRLNRSDTCKLSLGVINPQWSGVRTCQGTEGSFSIIPITFPSGSLKCVTISNHVGCRNGGYSFPSRSGVSGLFIGVFSKSRFRTSPKVAGSRQARRPSQRKRAPSSKETIPMKCPLIKTIRPKTVHTAAPRKARTAQDRNKSRPSA